MKKFRIEGIDLLARPLPPDRFDFAIGKQPDGANDATKEKPKTVPRRPPAYLLCRVTLRSSDGDTVVGWSGDRPSYGWLDKRDNRDSLAKLRSLIELIYIARDIWLVAPEFDELFPHWLQRHQDIVAEGAQKKHEPLTSSFASALFERAITDAVCRAGKLNVFDAIKDNALGIDPGLVHKELKGIRLAEWLPARPRTRFLIRHTVGLNDPLTSEDLSQRVDDGEPETLKEYAQRDGLHQYKIKISGDADRDIDRLNRIWEVIPISSSTAVTLDGNEAYDNPSHFYSFLSRLEYDAPGLFQHIRFVEQPLRRDITLDPAQKRWTERAAALKPLVIDEADGSLDAFKKAHLIGYNGVSHKNCKGFFKSLLNHALSKQFAEAGEWTFLTGEDLSCMPIVPLHQDFAALGVLGLRDCERNGHHYGFGLSHLKADEKQRLLRAHPDLYVQRGDNGEVFLRIEDGSVDCASLQCIGFGVDESTLPEAENLSDLQEWLDASFPSESKDIENLEQSQKVSGP